MDILSWGGSQRGRLEPGVWVDRGEAVSVVGPPRGGGGVCGGAGSLLIGGVGGDPFSLPDCRCGGDPVGGSLGDTQYCLRAVRWIFPRYGGPSPPSAASS